MFQQFVGILSIKRQTGNNFGLLFDDAIKYAWSQHNNYVQVGVLIKKKITLYGFLPLFWRDLWTTCIFPITTGWMGVRTTTIQTNVWICLDYSMSCLFPLLVLLQGPSDTKKILFLRNWRMTQKEDSTLNRMKTQRSFSSWFISAMILNVWNVCDVVYLDFQTT